MQNDIKKVLAYSTVSQLGYMMMGLGVGAWMPAVFHIFTHAFFKCCLFLCAGSVAHTGSHHSFDMKTDMGGLRKKMPVTFWTLDRQHGGAVRPAVLQRLLLQGRDHRLGEAQRLHGVLDRRPHRCVHDHGLHDPGHLPHLLRQGPRRRSPLRATGTTTTATTKPADEVHHDVDGHDTHAAPGARRSPRPGQHGKPLPFAPDDSPWQITVPLLILGVLALVSGYLNAAPFKLALASSTGSSRPSACPSARAACPEPPEFEWVNAAAQHRAGGSPASRSACILCKKVFGNEERSPFKGLTQRNGLLGAGHKFLVNKYYLDALYEKVIVQRHRPPHQQGRLLDQPAHPRRHRQRRRQGRQAHR